VLKNVINVTFLLYKLLKINTSNTLLFFHFFNFLFNFLIFFFVYISFVFVSFRFFFAFFRFFRVSLKRCFIDFFFFFFFFFFCCKDKIETKIRARNRTTRVDLNALFITLDLKILFKTLLLY